MVPRRFLGLVAATLVAVSVTAPARARAAPGRSFLTQYRDLAGYDWARPAIAWNTARGLMQGGPQGRLEPALPTTRAEAITLLVRGLPAPNQTGSPGLPLSAYILDASSVPSWAQSEVLAAAQRGILPRSDDGLLRASQPASRLWTTVLVVKALGLEGEAASRGQAQLPYTDAARIPRSLLGYVAVATERGLLRGDATGAFAPERTVTRAEMAVIVARADQLLGLQTRRPGELRGTVTSVDAGRGQVTVQTDLGPQTLTVAADAALFNQRREVGLQDIRAGSQVLILLDASGQVRLLDTDPLVPAGTPGVPGPAPGPQPPVAAPPPTGGVWIDGVVASYASGQPAAGGTLALVPYRDLQDGRVQSLTVMPGATFRDGPLPTWPGNLSAGDRVTVVAQGTTVSEVMITRRARAEEKETTGVITDLRAARGDTLARLTVEDPDGQEVTFWVVPGATLEDVDGSELAWDELEENWEVRITSAFGLALRIEVTSHTGGRTEAVVSGIDTSDPPRGALGTIVLAHVNEDGEPETYDEYPVDRRAELVDDRGRDIDLEDLGIGDKVLVRLDEDEYVVELRLVVPGDSEEDTVEGELVRADDGTRRDLPTVTIRRRSRTETYFVATGAEILDDRGDPVDDVDTLDRDFAGMDVRLTIRNGLVTRVEVL